MTRRPATGPLVALLALALLVAPGRIGSAAGTSASADGAPRELRGRVAAVSDGDTLTLRSEGRRVRVRLAQIDAPELAQPHGEAARRALERLALDRRARVVVVDTDRYGRVVGEVWVEEGSGERHLNEALVRAGHAWAYTRYSPSTAILALEDEARGARRGLWALPPGERDPPWAWRRARRHEAPEESDDAPARCRRRPRCGDLASCREARFQLEHCGARRLDGDGDGVPCEALCGPGR